MMITPKKATKLPILYSTNQQNHSPLSLSISTMSLLFLLLLLLLSFLTTPTTTISSDLTALLSFRSSVHGRTLHWNTTTTTPCNFHGVHCQNNRVTALHLPASSLSGKLLPNTLSNLTFLKTLSLRFNHLYGPLPYDISKLSHLKCLYLQGNNFSGQVPHSLFSVVSLVRIDLAGNFLSGGISVGFSNLTRLKTLFLEENRFSGVLPDIVVPKLELFNVSFNHLLNGSVPIGFRGFSNNSFLGTDIYYDNNLENSTTYTRKDNKKLGLLLSGGAIAGIVIGCLVFAFLLLLVLIILCRKRKRSGSGSRSVGIEAVVGNRGGEEGGEMPIVGFGNEKSENGGGSFRNEVKKLVFFGSMDRVFDLEELLRASAEVLGKGTYGTTYKAALEMGIGVAVKRLRDVCVSEREFKERVCGVGGMEHENLVSLRAYYYSKEEKLLVYDYLPMGSLSALLHGNKGAGHTPLEWEIRSNIALGAVRGIEYLHSQGQYVVHGNIKSSNVLLNKSHEARLSDFGLYYLVGPPSSPTRASGYRAPEVIDPRNVSHKSDVYSLGVLLLELLTGKAPTRAVLNEDGIDLSRWVQSVVREEWTNEVFDQALTQDGNAHVEDMVQLLQVAIDCTAQHPDKRPAISEVARRVQKICVPSLVQIQGKDDHVSEAD